MNWIEIAGPSGVGKSTLLKSLIEQRNNKKHQWVSREEALIEIAREKKSYNGGRNKLKHFLLKRKIFKNSHKYLALELLQHSNGYKKALNDYRFLMDSFLKKEICFERGCSIDKAISIKRYYSLLEMAAVIDLHQLEKTVVWDEGLFNRNKAIFNAEKNNEWILPSAVVYCKVNVHENFQRIKTRGRIALPQREFNDEELYSHIEKMYVLAEERIEKLKSWKVPLMEVSLDRIDKNTISKVGAFINTRHQV